MTSPQAPSPIQSPPSASPPSSTPILKNGKDYITSNLEEYTPTGLWLYDLLVLRLIARFVWRCPTSTNTLPLFRANASSRHLDIGVATGYFTANHSFPAGSEVTLCDLNETCLETASARFHAAHHHHHHHHHRHHRHDPSPSSSSSSSPSQDSDGIKCETLKADILHPLPASLTAQSPNQKKFDSISLLYLLHTLPSPLSNKTAVFSNIKPALSPHGTVFGATVLGEREYHTPFSWWFLQSANRGPFLDNLGDTRQGLEEGLRGEFGEVETWVVGAVMMFWARGPIE